MRRTEQVQGLRLMKFEEVYGRTHRSGLSQAEAAEVLGVSERTFRRWRRIGGQPKNHVEVDETWVGGRTRGEGRGVHHKVPVSCAIEVRHRKPGTKLDNRDR